VPCGVIAAAPAYSSRSLGTPQRKSLRPSFSCQHEADHESCQHEADHEIGLRPKEERQWWYGTN
jgi:hypothetical protein